MEYPEISVIVPSYQQAAHLPMTLDSVLSQEGVAVELIVVDGGSQDDSVSVIRQREDRIAWWCSEPDDGQAAAINKGLARATGDVVGWLNSDDILLPGALRAIAEAMADHSVQAVCGWAVTVDEKGDIIGQRVYPQPTAAVLMRRSLLSQPTVYWRKELLASVGPLDDSLTMVMDLDYWVRLAERGVVPRLIRRHLAGFRRHGNQKTQQRIDVWRQEELAIWRRLHGPDADRKALRKSVPTWWRLRYNIMTRLAKRGLACRMPKDLPARLAALSPS